MRSGSFLCLSAILTAITLLPSSAWAQPNAAMVELKPGDHVAYIGNTLADRMQHDGWLEARMQAIFPVHNLVFRNLGYPADEVKDRIRADNFGSQDQWLTKVEADIVFGFFGYNEAFDGEDGLAAFEQQLTEMLDGMLKQQYNGESAPRIVMFSPIAHENLHSPHLPDGSDNNRNLELYANSIEKVCQLKNIAYVDLFHPSLAMYEAAAEPLTLNGIHLVRNGNRQIANHIVGRLFSDASRTNKPAEEWEKLREAVVEKNLHWFNRYRVVDEYNVFGVRSKLEWFGQSNADVMMREMEIFDVMTANRDARVWAIARGSKLEVMDDNLPEEMAVKTNKPGPLDGEKFEYLSAEDTVKTMKLAEGLEANVFASEAMFPELINPVQMAVDPDGRLFTSVWPSYPHWNPTKARRDRILCMPDEDGDGVADACHIFADELNSVTGFEFWGGGMLVAAPPEIWFLKDTDGDEKADVKVRMLQGVSSADTHHSANAVVIGTEGGLYWSRGIFNVASMETPTGTYRSGKSGVHRFDPRTFEMSFMFPIGPNPHGHVIDQWGYHFANDGTSGTGSYINIGKGVGNKKWFEKRVRPVAATGILSSSHFPDEMQGNFLICNCIGVLGVLQHTVHYDGADITAKEVEPLLLADDPNFRPSDIEIGGDGALYVSDWSNILIGHMQHNMRDPNRDAEHGRIYRVTAKGRPLVKTPKMKGQPVADVCKAFYAKENSVRYRARLELSGRDSKDIAEHVPTFAAGLDPLKADDAQALLECLWVFEEQRIPNRSLLVRVFSAKEPLVRAAAIRTLGNWGTKIDRATDLLSHAAEDESGLVRAEAVKAAVSLSGMEAAEIVFVVAELPTDAELDTVLKYAGNQLNLKSVISETIAAKQPLSKSARAYALLNSSVDDLLKLNPAADVYESILNRPDASATALRAALGGLATIRKTSSLPLLLDLIEERDASNGDLASLQSLLAETPVADLNAARKRIEKLATTAQTADVRQTAMTAWITADGSSDDAYLAATHSKQSLRDFLNAVPAVADEELRATVFETIRPLLHSLPASLETELSGAAFGTNGIHVDYFYPSTTNVAIETLAKMTPKASGVVPAITMDVPQRKEKNRFALRFSGAIQIPQSGRYEFFITSDDGSRIYIDDKLLVNHDGLHGMSQKSGKIDLTVGQHTIVVTYFDNGGRNGLAVNWAGPGFKKGPIAPESLSVLGNDTIHDVAVRTFAAIPGHSEAKVNDLAALMKSGRSRAAVVNTLRSIPVKEWPQTAVRPMTDNLVGYLSEMPAALRTGAEAAAAIDLSKSLAPLLPEDAGQALLERLNNLDVRVIALGTVPARMIYDKEVLVVQAGKPVEFRFSNSDHMPHNFAIVQPGALQEIGESAEATARDADAIERHYIPKSDKVMLASRLLQPGETQALSFEVPDQPGVYPYVCTYPGHWRRMFGAMYVVASLDDYLASPDTYLADNALPIKDSLLSMTGRNHEWTIAELSPGIKSLKHGRAFEVGQQLFKVANCVACHQLNGEGRVFGPDLAKLDPKKQTVEHFLESIIEPSKVIDDKFRSWTFVLASGKTITGMIMKETDEEVHVVIDPLAKNKPTILKVDDIDDRVKSDSSLMPKSLLSRLTEEEIFDLFAYVYSVGNKDHMLFHGDHHNH
jgi:putative heme-binding domain-containing protein